MESVHAHETTDMRSAVETRTQIRRVAVPMHDPGSAQADRDEDHLDAVVLITDRGIQHTRNEDAGAAGTVQER